MKAVGIFLGLELLLLGVVYVGSQLGYVLLDVWTPILLAMLGALTLYPFVSSIGRGDEDILSLINVVGIQYFLYFVVRGVILVANPEGFLAGKSIATYQIDEGLATATSGFAMLLLGYKSPIYRFLLRISPRFYFLTENSSIDIFLSSQKVVFWAYLIGTAGRILNITFLGFQGSALIASDLAVKPVLGYSNLVIIVCTVPLYVTVLDLVRRLQLGGSLIPVVFLAVIETLYQFMAGWKAGFMPVLIAMLLAYHYLHRPVTLRNLIYGAALVAPVVSFVFPLVTMYRSYVTAFVSINSISVFTLAEIGRQAIESIGNLDAASLAPIANRFAGLDSLIVIVSGVSFYRLGETLTPILSFFVPRVLWPGKPTMSLGYDFAVQFLGWDRVYRSEAAITQMGDWYWNFGILGVLFGMFIMGVLYRYIYSFFIESRGFSPLAVFVYVIAFPIFINIEYNIAFWVGAMITGLLAPTVFLFIVLKVTKIIRGDRPS